MIAKVEFIAETSLYALRTLQNCPQRCLRES
jgi:hypothetical protein